jgi:uncharacterized protein
MTSRNWAMLLHFSVLLGYPVTVLGFVAPIIIWQIKKDEFPELDAHGKEVLNFLISLLIYSVVAGLLVLAFIGIFLLMALGLVGIIFPIIGGIKANNGELWRYPLILRLVK